MVILLFLAYRDFTARLQEYSIVVKFETPVGLFIEYF